MARPFVFLSYSREDRMQASRFAHAMEREGFQVWWDAVLHSGETFDEVIEKNLRRADAVVVLWSPRSVASRWVRAEATQGDRHGKLVPAIIESCDLPIAFELTHTTNLSHWRGDEDDPHWMRFLADLRHRSKADEPVAESTPPQSRAEPDPPRQPQPQQPRQPQSGEPADPAPPRGGTFPMARPTETARESKPQFMAPDDPTQFATSAASPHQPSEAHFLILTEQSEPVAHYAIGPLGVTIGRSPPADIVLGDARVSRSHCQLELAEDGIAVEDLNSTNGTYVDGNRISGRTELPVGAELRVGSCRFIHEKREASATA